LGRPKYNQHNDRRARSSGDAAALLADGVGLIFDRLQRAGTAKGHRLDHAALNKATADPAVAGGLLLPSQIKCEITHSSHSADTLAS